MTLEGKYVEVKTLLLHVISILIKHKNTNTTHPDIINLEYCLACTMYYLHEYEQSEELYRKVLCSCVGYGEDIHTGRAREGLAQVLLATQRTGEIII